MYFKAWKVKSHLRKQQKGMLQFIAIFAVILYAIHVTRKDKREGREWTSDQLADKYMRTGYGGGRTAARPSGGTQDGEEKRETWSEWRERTRRIHAKKKELQARHRQTLAAQKKAAEEAAAGGDAQ